MADANQELLALLKKEQEIHKSSSMSEDEKKVAYYRRKKAQDFVQGYKAILLLKAELIEGGLDPAEFTARLAEDALVEQWTIKAVDKSTEAI